MRISILLPTRNSRALLPAHLQSLNRLLDSVGEVIVVDSESSDGTWEYLQANLKHPNTSFYQHPPGLYASWNFGIQQAKEKFLYISTIGDEISVQGLQKLAMLLEQNSAEVALSLPRYMATNGKEQSPAGVAHDLRDFLNGTTPVLLNPEFAWLFAVSKIPNAFLTSCASNLFAAEFLKRNPFPTNFGTSGDAPWGLANLLGAKTVFVPEMFSTFLLHEKSYSADSTPGHKLRSEMLAVAEVAFQRTATEVGTAFLSCARKMLESKRRWFGAQRILDDFRQGGPSWVLKPAAWRARLVRRKEKRKVAELLRRFQPKASNS